MFKKRKLNPATLEELAKRYSQDIISDEDARNIVGGTIYINESGMLLIQVGSGSDIRVCGASYSLDALNGWTGSIGSYYMTIHQCEHSQDWLGGFTGSITEYKEEGGFRYDPSLYKLENGRLYWIGGDEYKPPYTDHFEGCCKSIDYGAVVSSGMPVPDFIKYSVAFSNAPVDVQERIRATYPHLFSDGDIGGSGITGNI